MCSSDFVFDFEEISAGWKAKEGTDFEKKLTQVQVRRGP